MGMNSILADLEDDELDFGEYGDDDENEEERKTSTVDTSRPVSKSSR
jgi:hypothetical protein